MTGCANTNLTCNVRQVTIWTYISWKKIHSYLLSPRWIEQTAVFFSGVIYTLSGEHTDKKQMWDVLSGNGWVTHASPRSHLEFQLVSFFEAANFTRAATSFIHWRLVISQCERLPTITLAIHNCPGCLSFYPTAPARSFCTHTIILRFLQKPL